MCGITTLIDIPLNSFLSIVSIETLKLKLLVYGVGQVVPSSLVVLKPNLKYSLFVGISSAIQYGRLVLAMDRNFCTDAAGNTFTRSANSSFYVHFGEIFICLSYYILMTVIFKVTY
ncbi:hypothetical protein REPUB_Repub07fG0106300 [Reevesia pubescens]